MADALAPFSMSGLDTAEELTDRALVLAQRLGVTGPHWIDLLIHRGIVLGTRDRKLEAAAYFREAFRLGIASDSPLAQARALLNLGDSVSSTDPAEGLRLAHQVVDLARQTGARYYLLYGTSNGVLCALVTGEWDTADALVTSALEADGLTDVGILVPTAALMSALRGDASLARTTLAPLAGERRDTQEASYLDYVWAVVLEAEGDYAGCLERAQRSAEMGIRLGVHSDMFRLAWPLAARAATATHDDAATKALVGLLDGRHDGELSRLLRAELELTRARALPDPTARAVALDEAVAGSREAGSPYHLAQALLDLAEARRALGDDAADLVAEALGIGHALRSPLVIGRAERS